MKKGTLLRDLARVEQKLPELIADSAGWQSLDINYEPPHVKRLWRDVVLDPEDDGLFHYRVCLHQILPCMAALFHPHPWPSAVKILSGRYEMGLGDSATEIEPPMIATLVLAAGSSYEMVHPDGWHSVRPLDEPSYSLMIMAAPFATRHRGEKRPEGKLEPLSPTDAANLLGWFARFYLQRTR